MKKYDRYATYTSIILGFVVLLPMSSGYVDCRISCRRCRENTETASVVEIYCAMCEECKQRRRERLQVLQLISKVKPDISTTLSMKTEVKSEEYLVQQLLSPTTPSSNKNIAFLRHKPLQESPAINLHQLLQKPQIVRTQPLLHPLLPQQQQTHKPQQTQMHPQQRAQPPLVPMEQVQRQAADIFGWPPGCPTPPVCSEEEDEPANFSSATAPPLPICPPVYPCKNSQAAMAPPCVPCMPMCSCPAGTTHATQEPQPEKLKPKDPREDYNYVYLGIPKNALTS